MRKCDSGKIIIKKRKGVDSYIIKLNIIELDEINGDKRYLTKEISTDLTIGKRNFQVATVMLSDAIQGFDSTNNITLFHLYCWEWLKRKKVSVEVTTYESYEFKIKIISQYFEVKSCAINELSSSDIKEFYYFLISAERNVGKKQVIGYANRTIKDISVVLRMVLNEAKELGYIQKNPAENIKIPYNYNKDAYRKNDYIDAESVEVFLKAINGHRLELAFIFGLYYGLRREEILGLKWSAIADYKYFSIKHTVARVGTLVAKDRAKTDASYRTYPISEPIKNLLLLEKKKQDMCRKIYGANYHDTGYLFTKDNGTPYHPDYLTKAFKKIVRQQDLLSDSLTLHSLRASCVSILVHEGIDIKDIQEWIGHRDIYTTLSIYARTNEKQKRKVDEKMLKTFFNNA